MFKKKLIIENLRDINNYLFILNNSILIYFRKINKVIFKKYDKLNFYITFILMCYYKKYIYLNSNKFKEDIINFNTILYNFLINLNLQYSNYYKIDLNSQSEIIKLLDSGCFLKLDYYFEIKIKSNNKLICFKHSYFFFNENLIFNCVNKKIITLNELLDNFLKYLYKDIKYKYNIDSKKDILIKHYSISFNPPSFVTNYELNKKEGINSENNILKIINNTLYNISDLKIIDYFERHEEEIKEKYLLNYSIISNSSEHNYLKIQYDYVLKHDLDLSKEIILSEDMSFINNLIDYSDKNFPYIS